MDSIDTRFHVIGIFLCVGFALHVDVCAEVADEDFVVGDFIGFFRCGFFLAFFFEGGVVVDMACLDDGFEC